MLRVEGFLNASMTIVITTRDPGGTRIISNFYIFQIKSTFSAVPVFLTVVWFKRLRRTRIFLENLLCKFDMIILLFLFPPHNDSHLL